MNKEIFDGKRVEEFETSSGKDITKRAFKGIPVEFIMTSHTTSESLEWYIIVMAMNEGIWYEVARYNYKYIASVLWAEPIKIS